MEATLVLTINASPVYDTVTLAVNDTTMGSVRGAGIYDEGDTVTLYAIANTGYHFVMWSDGDSNAARTVELTSDSTIAAIFDYNPSLTLVYDDQNGHVEFIVETQTATFTGIQTASLSDGGVSVIADSADGSGMSMKNGKTITIATDGSSVITQVAFHLTNGTNKASSSIIDTVNATITGGSAVVDEQLQWHRDSE